MVIVTDKKYYLDGYAVKICDSIVDRVQKRKQDILMLFDGREGCLSGDTIINVSRNKVSRKYTIKQLYEKLNAKYEEGKRPYKQWDLKTPCFVRSFNGEEIRLNRLIGATSSGKKEVYELTLENGRKINATKTHRFMTEDGWKELSKLSTKDNIMCDKLNANSNGRKRIKLYDVLLKVPLHPYCNIGERVEVHRLIYESYINNLKFTTYLDILLNEEEVIKTLKFVNPQETCIHHKDGNHYNNSINNLELKKRDEHSFLHSITGYKNFNQGTPFFSKVKQIINLGVKETYDLQCEAPHHNFVANGMIVHNSGKTNASVAMAYYIGKKSGRKFGVENMFFDLDAMIKFAGSTKEQIILWDEAALGGLSSDWSNKSQRKLKAMLMVCRKLRHVFLFNVPRFYRLNADIIERAQCLMHIYENDKEQPGNFMFISADYLSGLYINWKSKKYADYWKFKKLHGCFTFVIPQLIDEEAYEKDKDAAILKLAMGEEEDKKKGKWEVFENKVLMNTVHNFKESGLSQKEIAIRMDISPKTLQKWGKEWSEL